MNMSEIIALRVNIIDVKDNFVHLHRRYLSKFRNSKNDLGTIKIEANRTQYASCHATAFNSNGENALNISSTFAKTLGVDESDTVIISTFLFMPSLRTVLVSPISADDLPIMEDKADAIQVTLLSQIRIVVKHQILTIWVSKSVSVRVHVDRLDGDLNHGKLEEHTEVVVSFNTNACNDCNDSRDDELKNKSTSTWNIFKKLFSFDKHADNIPIEEQSAELKLKSEGVFRCVPIDANVFKFEEHIQHYPYHAFISRRYRIKKNENNFSVCRLTHLPYIPSKITNPVQENKHDLLPNNEVFVHLYEIDETNIVNEIAYSQIYSYPSIFVSKSVFYSLRLKINSKVKLELVVTESKFKPTQIDFLVVKGETDEANVAREIRNSFQAPLVRGIVNNGHLFALDRCGENVVRLSFNPVNIPFVELNLRDAHACYFCATKNKLDFEPESDVNESQTTLLPLDFQQKIVSKVQMRLLVRLRLLQPSREDDDENLENSYHTILEGDTGTGKSSIAMLLKEKMEKSWYRIFMKRLECKTMKGKLIFKLEKLLEAALVECLHHEPAVLCLDDLDVLFASSKQSTQVQSQLSTSSYSNRLSHIIYDLVYKYSKYRVTVLATVKNCSAFESRLFQARGICLFSDRLLIPAMDQTMRRECLVQLLSSKPDLVYEDHLSELVRRTEGYCVQDLFDLVNRLYFEVLKRYVETRNEKFAWIIQPEDVNESLSSLVPLALAGINLHKSSSVTWKDVGGLEMAKRVLTEVLIWPSKFPEIFDECPLKLQSGVLLYGVPGSGKTLLARAVAGESGLNFISIKGPELLSKFVGESEEGVRNIFRKARNAKPCILFFDEFDSLVPRRGNDITGVTDRVVNQLLTELDGVETVSGVWVLAATSRPDLIDAAVLRPGRLGTTIRCPLPNEEERRRILEIMSHDLPETDGQIDWKSVASVTAGYSGADLRAVLYAATALCDTTRIREVETCLMCKGVSPIPSKEVSSERIDTACLMKAVQGTSASLKREEMLSYEIIYKQFERKDKGIHLSAQQKVTLA